MKYKTIAANLSAIGYRSQKPNKTYYYNFDNKGTNYSNSKQAFNYI